jgi:D-hexose-6-phosphate mutarotase
VTGLKGFELKDSLNSHRSTEEREQVTINSEVDRVYENVSTDLMVQNTQIGNGISIKKENFKDVVVWNPWIENAKKMVDFDDNEYLEMVCVEVGTVATFVKLNPNEEWRGKQTLECL